MSELGLSMDGGVSHVAFLYLGPSFLVEVIQIFRQSSYTMSFMYATHQQKVKKHKTKFLK